MPDKPTTHTPTTSRRRSTTTVAVVSVLAAVGHLATAIAVITHRSRLADSDLLPLPLFDAALTLLPVLLLVGAAGWTAASLRLWRRGDRAARGVLNAAALLPATSLVVAIVAGVTTATLVWLLLGATVVALLLRTGRAGPPSGLLSGAALAFAVAAPIVGMLLVEVAAQTELDRLVAREADVDDVFAAQLDDAFSGPVTFTAVGRPDSFPYTATGRFDPASCDEEGTYAHGDDRFLWSRTDGAYRVDGPDVYDRPSQVLLAPEPLVLGLEPAIQAASEDPADGGLWCRTLRGLARTNGQVTVTGTVDGGTVLTTEYDIERTEREVWRAADAALIAVFDDLGETAVSSALQHKVRGAHVSVASLLDRLGPIELHLDRDGQARQLLVHTADGQVLDTIEFTPAQ